jgi:adenylate cyclase
VVVPLLDTGMSEAEAIEAASRFGEEAAPLVDRAILGLYHAQQEHAWTRSLVERVETALEEAGLASRLRRPPAVCFLDLSGFTRLTEERGDQAAARTAAELARIVQRTSAEHRGTPVKWLGDGVMSYFDVPGDAVVAALEMRELVSGAGLPPPHIGLDAGPVIFQDGDYFGRTVNTAARIAAYAHADEVLVSERVLEAGCMEGVAFEPVGPIALKGVAEPVTLHRASRAANVG